MESSLKHDFTVEIKSKQFLRNVSISDEARKLVLFEGSLGKTVELSLVEGDVLDRVFPNINFGIASYPIGMTLIAGR